MKEYYASTENSYIDSWHMNQVHALHYGYWDDKVKTFPQSLLRMNEVMMQMASITKDDLVLDAGCGVGGSSIFLAKTVGCKCMGITLSPTQIPHANKFANAAAVSHLVNFKEMNYSKTNFENESFDIVWGNESICYADDKNEFVKEAYRLLKPGGRLILGEGFVSKKQNNDLPAVRKMLDGWQINYLDTPEDFIGFMKDAGFTTANFKDITPFVMHSSRRLLGISILATLYGWWKSLIFSNKWTPVQKPISKLFGTNILL
ncbi:MAG: methyltransferase domain-containing protein [Chitinophagaceae bacterium]|nr:methyltransferase domain-containing protein [Chitinophagaceae bacterium]